MACLLMTQMPFLCQLRVSNITRNAALTLNSLAKFMTLCQAVREHTIHALLSPRVPKGGAHHHVLAFCSAQHIPAPVTLAASPTKVYKHCNPLYFPQLHAGM